MQTVKEMAAELLTAIENHPEILVSRQTMRDLAGLAEATEPGFMIMQSNEAGSDDSSGDTLHNPKPESDILADIERELVAKGYTAERAAELAPWELHVRMGGD